MWIRRGTRELEMASCVGGVVYMACLYASVVSREAVLPISSYHTTFPAVL